MAIPTIDMLRTGQNINRLRKAAGISVKDLQDIFGFGTPQAIYKWQHGTALPTIDNLVVLAAVLGVKVDDVLVMTDSGICLKSRLTKVNLGVNIWVYKRKPTRLYAQYFLEVTKMVNISDAEWKIMNVLWEKSPSTIMQITKGLYETTGWTKHTVMTLLKRLEDKGAVYYEEGERAKQYYAKIPQNEAVVEEAKSFLQKAFKGKLGLMINTMIKEEAISQEDLDELYEILEKGKAEE